MITKQDILQATDKELPKLLGEVLRGGKHVMFGSHPHYYCANCDFHAPLSREFDAECKGTPIPLTWDNAMKWRDWAVESFAKLDVWDAMTEVSDEYNRSYDRQWLWWTTEAQPEHYLKAAALCKLNAERKGR